MFISSIEKLSNTDPRMVKSVKKKEQDSNSLLHNHEQEPDDDPDSDTIEKVNSVDGIILDIPEPVINQSRNHSAVPQKENEAENSNQAPVTSWSQEDQDTIDSLKSDWLEEAEEVIADRYGLTGDGADLSIVLDNNPEPFLASTNFVFGPDGKAYNESLHVVVPTAIPAALPDGGEAPYYDDRVITHEMVHAIMGRTMNFKALPTWFDEGTAEFIHGADERVAKDLSRNGGGMKGAEAVQSAIGDGTDNTWVSDSLHYSAATMAVRYLHKQIEAAGNSGGIKDLLGDLKDHPEEDLDQALSHVSRYANTQEFIRDYVKNGNGKKFINNLDHASEFKNAVNGGDTGSIGGASADQGPVRTSTSVIPDIDHPTDAPLKNFHVIWPALHPDISPSMPALSANPLGSQTYQALKNKNNRNMNALGKNIDIVQ